MIFLVLSPFGFRISDFRFHTDKLGGGGREKGKLPGPKGKRESSPGPPGPTKEKPHDLAQPKGKREKAGQQNF